MAATPDLSTIYVSASGAELGVSRDYGATWTNLTSSGVATRYALRCSPDGTKVAYTFIKFDVNWTQTGGIAISLDSGATWTEKTYLNGLPFNPDFSDPTKPNEFSPNLPWMGLDVTDGGSSGGWESAWAGGCAGGQTQNHRSCRKGEQHACTDDLSREWNTVTGGKIRVDASGGTSTSMCSLPYARTHAPCRNANYIHILLSCTIHSIRAPTPHTHNQPTSPPSALCPLPSTHCHTCAHCLGCRFHQVCHDRCQQLHLH